MDIRSQLLFAHSKKNTHIIVSYINDNEEKFARLMHLFLEDEYRVVQRAAHAVSILVEKYPFLINPYIETIVDYLSVPNHVAVQRNTMRLLQYIDIPQKYHGKIIEICFDFILDPNAAIAVRAFSIEVAHQITRSYPEIREELLLVLGNLSPSEPPGIKSKKKKYLN